MRHGKPLQVTAYDRGNQAKIATGKLQTIDNQIDTTTGTVKLRAIFPNENDALFPNLFVNTKLLVNTLQNVTLVPSSTIQQNGDVSYVFVIRNGTAYMQDVKTGITESQETVIEGSESRRCDGGQQLSKAARQIESGAVQDGDSAQHEREQRSVNPSRPFILRPVATSLLMAAIMLIGIVGYTQLPVSALPEVDYPTIQVVTFYPAPARM